MFKNLGNSLKNFVSHPVVGTVAGAALGTAVAPGIGTLVGAGIGGSVSGALASMSQSDKNVALQREQFEYQKQLNQTAMDREDNAVQRRAADLMSAGLSPTLAAGSAAQTAHMSSAPAPQHDVDHRANAHAIASQIAMGLQLENMVAQNSYLKAQENLVTSQQNRIDTLLPYETFDLYEQSRLRGAPNGLWRPLYAHGAEVIGSLRRGITAGFSGFRRSALDFAGRSDLNY